MFLSSRFTCSVLAWCAAAFAGMLQLWMMICDSLAHISRFPAHFDVILIWKGCMFADASVHHPQCCTEAAGGGRKLRRELQECPKSAGQHSCVTRCHRLIFWCGTAAVDLCSARKVGSPLHAGEVEPRPVLGLHRKLYSNKAANEQLAR